MNVLYVSFRNVLARPLSSLLTLIMLIMGVGLVSLLLLVGDALDSSFRKNINGIDMVVGAKGSPLQLILSAVYQIDNPTGNISRKEALALKRNQMVESVIELSYGDSYKGVRIIGTSHDYPALYGASVSEGRLWNAPFEATVGHRVAEEQGLRPGDVFYSAHGNDAGAEAHEDHPYTVVGVFDPTGTVADRLILTAPESVWLVHHTPGDSLHAEERQITALLVKFKNKMGIISLPRFVNQQTSMQAALPSIEINRLISLFGVGIATLRSVAVALMVLGAVSVLVSMINSLRERSYEMALLRSMGASRSQVFGMVVTEALLLATGGVLGGLIVARLGILALGAYADEFGIVVDIYHLDSAELVLAFFTLILCTFAALLPAYRTSTMDVSKVLSSYD